MKPYPRSSPSPPPLCCSAAGVPEDLLLPLPNWSKGRRSSSSRTCDRIRRCCPFVAPIFITTLRSASDRLHHPREPFSLNLLVFEGESFSNRYKLSPRCDLGCCNRRKFFCFLCIEPISGIRASSMRRCFVRLEHIEMWALIL